MKSMSGVFIFYFLLLIFHFYFGFCFSFAQMLICIASRALEHMNFTPVNGKPIRIMYSNRDPTTRKSGSGNIFVKVCLCSLDEEQYSLLVFFFLCIYN